MSDEKAGFAELYDKYGTDTGIIAALQKQLAEARGCSCSQEQPTELQEDNKIQCPACKSSNAQWGLYGLATEHEGLLAKYVIRCFACDLEYPLPFVDILQSQLTGLQEEIAGRKHDYNDLFNITKAADTNLVAARGRIAELELTMRTMLDGEAGPPLKASDDNDSAMPSPELNALRIRARQLGWSYIQVNAAGKLVGIPPSPASNHDLIEIKSDLLERPK